MKKTITHLFALATLLIVATGTATGAQFIPSLTNGPSVTLTTTKAIDETIELRVKGETDNVWIDLNSNETYDEGERIGINILSTYTLKSQTVTIYGDLTALFCNGNQFTSLKFNKLLTKLKEFNCSDNKLTSLDLSGQTGLMTLFCYKNELTSLDVNNLTSLTWIDCSKNKLTSLDISKLADLKELSCSSNQLTSLDLSKVTNLAWLSCSQNKLTSLDVSKLAYLTKFWCYNNQIKEAEMQKIVDALPSVTSGSKFYPYNTKEEDNEQNQCTLAQVAIATGKGWKVLDPSGKIFPGVEVPSSLAPTSGPSATFTTTKAINETIELMVKGETDNIWIDLNGNGTYDEGEKLERNQELKLTIQSQTLTLYGDLTMLECSSNQVKSLDLSKLTNLKELYCSSNLLTSLDLSKTTNLIWLSCDSNQLTNLDLSKTTNLIWLYCYNNKLTSLVLGNLAKLETLDCKQNLLTSLDLSKLTSLNELYCNKNQLTSLTLGNPTKLKHFTCFQNQIKKPEMQKIVKALPTVTHEAKFYPYNPKNGANEQNQCTTDQVAIATGKGWKVLDPNSGIGFPGVGGLEDITASQLPIALVAKEGLLLISGLEIGMPVVVYTIDGTSLYSGIATDSEMSITLPAGSCVLRIGNYSAKTLIP